MLSVDNRGAAEKPTDRGHGFPLLSLSTAESGKSSVLAESDFTFSTRICICNFFSCLFQFNHIVVFV